MDSVGGNYEAKSYRVGAAQVMLVIVGMFSAVLVTSASTSFFMGKEMEHIITNSRHIDELMIGQREIIIDQKDLRRSVMLVEGKTYSLASDLIWIKEGIKDNKASLNRSIP